MRTAPTAVRGAILAIPAAALAAIVLVPFLGKAFTIDDTLFLEQARHVLVDALHPTAFDGVWSRSPERMSQVMASGPAMAYLLVPTVVSGGREWVAHLTQLALLVLALGAAASLALRLGYDEAGARAAALLLAATPAVLGMAGTAMPDVAAMAFGLLGVERAVGWLRERRWHQAAAAVSCLSVAALSRSHLLLLVAVPPLLAIGAWWTRAAWTRDRIVALAPLLAVPAIVAAVLAATRDPEASRFVLASAAKRSFVLEAAPSNVLAYFAHWSLAIPFALPAVALAPRRILLRPAGILTALAAWVYLRPHPETHPVLVAAAAGLAGAALWDVASRGVRERDGLALALVAWMLTPLVIVPYLHLPSKYLLAAAPAAALVIARGLIETSRARAYAVLTAAVASGALLGFGILRADATFAGLGRAAVTEFIGSRAAGVQVWFDGHWGFQWYAERAGALPLSSEPPYPASGDLVVVARSTQLGMLDSIPTRRPLETIIAEGSGGRIMSRSDGAGFYSNGFGYLPWAWGSEPVDRYELWVLE